MDAHLRHPHPITTSSCSFIDDECHLRRMWLVKRWSSSFYIIRSALYGIVVLLDQNRLLAETFTRNAQLPPQQPHKPVLCTHTQTADPPPSYSFVAIVFLDPNRKPQLLGIVVNDRLTSGSSIPPLWSSVFCATSARWFHDRQQLVDKEIIQSCFVVAADAISFFWAVRYIWEQGGGA